MTETWLSDENEEDGAWVSCMHLKKVRFKISTSNRKNHGGGGLALIHKTLLSSNLLEEGSTRSFQFALWSTKVPVSNVTLVELYHPPYSSKAPITNRMFIDNITNCLPDILIKYNNVVLIGDVTIHLNNHTSDDDAGIFSDMLEAMGFIIHMTIPTHCPRNAIDLIATQSGSTLDVTSCTCGPYLSDHCVLNCTTSVVHEEAIRKSITYKKMGYININKFITDCDLLNIILSEVDDMVNAFNIQLLNALDDNAPEITKQVMVRKKVPWFTQEIREKKRVVCRRETIWKKYRRDDQWQVLKIERSSYRQMLKKAKAESITVKIDDCKRDNKKLYNLAALLMGMMKENPLPGHTDKEELANQFANFFITKIQKIRDQLDNLPIYCHTSSNPPEFLEFELMVEEEVGTIIRGMPAKMCDVDIIPTALLKDALPGLLPTITKIANASMTQGVFPSSWKIALFKPLLKKLDLELTESN